MNRHAIYHQPYSEQAYGLTEDLVVLRFRAAKGEVKSSCVYYRDRFQFNGKQELYKAQMELIATDAMFDHYEATLSDTPARLAYYFEIEGADETLFLGIEGVMTTLPEKFNQFFELHYNHREDLPECADWFSRAVIYQIFPDSFADKKRGLDAKETKLPRPDGGISHAERGGTLRGIIENLDYIADMGFTCLYLNPVFVANTPHRYDTANYYDIDPLLGTKDDFRELVKQAHALDIKVIIDGVFNHSGILFFAFKDIMENGEKSMYKDWFYKIDGFPVDVGSKTRKPNYASFAYTGYMPKVNTANPEACQYFVDVITHYVREYDIDGWRLDVADELNVDFWRKARKAMKAVKRDTIFIGEIWGDARRWMAGDMFDSLMNYAVMHACDRFFNRKIDAEAFGALISAQLMRYRKPYQLAQMNLLDSHDTERFLGKLNGNVDVYKCAVAFLMTHYGVPSIYYGDELGLMDTEERLWRQTMPWERDGKSELQVFVKDMVKLRHENIDAVLGRFEQRYAAGRVYAFARVGAKQSLTVIINADDKPAKVDVPKIGMIELNAWDVKTIPC